MDGVPESLRQLAAQGARDHGEPEATAEAGPWRITLDAPVLMPFLEHGTRRDLREQLYRAYVTRASTGEYDNTAIIERILALRQEMARLLGFEDYAALSIDSKMAPSVGAVDSLLEDLRTASLEAARQDLETLQAFAADKGQSETPRALGRQLLRRAASRGTLRLFRGSAAALFPAAPRARRTLRPGGAAIRSPDHLGGWRDPRLAYRCALLSSARRVGGADRSLLPRPLQSARRQARGPGWANAWVEAGRS